MKTELTIKMDGAASDRWQSGRGLPRNWQAVGQASRPPLGRFVAESCAGETPEKTAGTAAPLPTHRAFSLIELVGVLAVIAILAAVLAPAFVRQMDKIAGDQESAALKSFGDALQQSIMRNRYIPTYTDWATNVAAELGVDVTTVTTNPRRNRRVFLIDGDLKIGNNSGYLPYTQTSAGSVVTNNSGVVIPPINPRLIILSSIGRDFPNTIDSGSWASNTFNPVWDWNENGNTLPAIDWGGWPGTSDDLKVERVNLSPLFVRLILTTNVSESAYYSIDSGATNKVTGSGSDGYFIRNSVLFLRDHTQTNIDSQQILMRDTSFVYEQNVWRSSLTGGSFLAGSLDLGSIVEKYLEAPENTNAMYTLTNNAHGNTNSMTQQSVVVSNMIAYMRAYTNWASRYAGQSPWPHDSYWSAADSAEQSMMTAVQGQYYKDGSVNFLPHPTDCQP